MVTAVTVRAFPDPTIVTFSLTGGGAFNSDGYWRAVEYLHEFIPQFNEAGGNMYYYLLPDYTSPTVGHVSAMNILGGFGNASSQAEVDALMLPFVANIGMLTGAPFTYVSSFHQKASNAIATFEKNPDQVGIRVILGSRILTRDFMKSANGPANVTAAIRSLKTYPGNTSLGSNAIEGQVVAGPAVWANRGTVDSALHPVWRNAMLHLTIARAWTNETTVEEQKIIQKNLTEVEVPILKALDTTPGGGAYLNEADPHEAGFQDSFWGSN